MISVLLPFRDAAATLAEAAASVLVDLGRDDELVAIDDGSRDGSRAALTALGDPRVRLVETRGVGVAKALSLGLATARGAFIARMDADDVSLPGRIPAACALLDVDPSLGAAATEIALEGAEREGLARYVAWQNGLHTPDEHADAIYVESPLCHPAAVLRRSALERVGGFADPPWPEDWDVWLRLISLGFGLAKVPRVLFRWRRGPASVTARDPRCSPSARLAARAHYLAAALGSRPFAIWGAGKTGKRLARALERAGAKARAFVDIDPKKVRARGVRVLEPGEGTAAALRGEALLVVAVGAPGARDEVRARLRAAGLRERRDFVCAA